MSRNIERAVDTLLHEGCYGGYEYPISKASEEEQIAGIRKRVDTIEFIKNPSEELQLVAVRQDGNAIHNIRSPYPSVVQLAQELGVGDAQNM